MENEERNAHLRKIIFHFSLVGFGIPVLLFASMQIFNIAVKTGQIGASPLVLDLVILVLALVGLGTWAFFSAFMYKRLWTIFDSISSREKIWEFMEGSYLFIGVGISLISAIAVFYSIITGDFLRPLFLFGLSALLFIFELMRFRSRVENTVSKHL